MGRIRATGINTGVCCGGNRGNRGNRGNGGNGVCGGNGGNSNISSLSFILPYKCFIASSGIILGIFLLISSLNLSYKSIASSTYIFKLEISVFF